MRISRLAALVAVAVTFAGLGEAQNTPSGQASFTISISAPQAAVRLGSPIVLRLTLTNTSDHDVSSAIATVNGEILRHMDVRVYDSGGKVVPETEHGMTIHGRPPRGEPRFGGGVAGRIKKGQSFQEESDLNKEFILDKPGAYTVQAEQFDYASKVLVRSNTITLTLTQ